MEDALELLKTFTNSLAKLAVTEDGAQVLASLRLTGLLTAQSGPIAERIASDSDATDNNKVDDVATSDMVGIWERKKGSHQFVRRLDKFAEWSLWSTMGKIEPKQGKKRIVFLGESAARGYLYEPQFTPAMALETILQSQFGKAEIEVLDLARISLGMEIKELAVSAMLLEPDAVIIFAGNNWGPIHPRSDLPYLAMALQQEGIPGLKRLIESRFEFTVRTLVKEISSFYKERNVPLIWVVPEFNLGDWRDPVSNAPYLLDNSNREWMVHWEEALASLKEGNIKDAAQLANRMIELDQGVSPAGFYILAACSEQAGDYAAQRKHLESARDSLRWDPTVKAPRPYSITQRVLREESAAHGNELVDLPKIFSEYLKGRVSDRRLFLDYCHLSAEGIQIAMAAAASSILRIFKRGNMPWRALAHHSFAPTAQMRAEAAFLAAIHNAHWYQSYELVRHYCALALKLSPQIVKVMTCFIDLQTQRTPMLMSEPAAELARLELPSIHHYLLRASNQNLDKLLLDAVIDSLKDIGIDMQERVHQRRLKEHSVSFESRNLLDYYYCSGFEKPQEAVLATPDRSAKRQAHFRTHSRESNFFFISDGPYPVRFTLTCRLSHIYLGEREIVVEVNGKHQSLASIDSEWSTWDITVGAEALRAGINEIKIRWPIPVFSGKDAITAAAQYMLRGEIPELYCPFGEIHSFTVSEVRGAEPDTLLDDPQRVPFWENSLEIAE